MAGNKEAYKLSTVSNEESRFFLEVPTDLSTPETKLFYEAFLRCENSNIDSGVETEQIKDVTQKVQPTEVKSYSITQTREGYFLKDDPVCKYLQHLFDIRAVGGAAHAYLLEVRDWDGKKAYKTDVTIAINSITNEGGDVRRISATFGYASDSIEGTATIDEEAGTAEFTPKGAD